MRTYLPKNNRGAARLQSLSAGVLAALLCLATEPRVAQAVEPKLEEVAAFPTQQVTGVTVSAKGRIFVNFPFWSDDHTTSVAEMVDGKPVPYPNAEWNTKSGPPEKRWVCVQSVVVDDQDALWVLDPASPKTEAVVPGGPKLVKIDLKTNQPVQTISFDPSIAPEKSYLNDVRFDAQTGHAFITESGTGAIIVVDLKTGKARRVLDQHPSTKQEPDATITVDGMRIVDPKTAGAPAFQVDGIALEGGWLYYHALTGSTLYRVKTEDLLDPSLTPAQLGKKVESLGGTPKPDGMLEGKHGDIYLAAFEQNAVAKFDLKTRKTSLVVQDERLQWPDTMAWDQTASYTSQPRRFTGCQSTTLGKVCKRVHSCSSAWRYPEEHTHSVLSLRPATRWYPTSKQSLLSAVPPDPD